MNSIGTLWVFGMMLVICADIFSRNVLNYPLNGVPEIIAFSIAGTIYLQLANTACRPVYPCGTFDRVA